MHYLQITDDQGQMLLEASHNISQEATSVQKNLLHAVNMTMLKSKVEEGLVPLKMGATFFKIFQRPSGYINICLFMGVLQSSSETLEILLRNLTDRIYHVLVSRLGYKVFFKEEASITQKFLRDEIQEARDSELHKEKLRQELSEMMVELKGLNEQIAPIKLCKSRISEMQENLERIKKTNKVEEEQLKTFMKNNQGKQGTIQFQRKVLKAFHQKSSEEFKKCEKKYKEIDVLEVVLLAKRKLLLFELCVIMFNQITERVFTNGLRLLGKGADEIFNISNQNKIEELNSTLGYMCLLNKLICKYMNVSPKFPIQFNGSRSLLFTPHDSVAPVRPLNLYWVKMAEKSTFRVAYKLFLANLQQILAVLKIDKTHRVNNYEYLMEVISQYMANGGL